MQARVKLFTARLALAFTIIVSLPGRYITVSCTAEERSPNDLDSPKEKQDYRINHCFNIGNRDGYADRKRKKSRSPEEQCNDAEGKEAHDLGYQLGLRGQRSYRRDHRLSSWARPRVSS
jgi:hypothetical protein